MFRKQHSIYHIPELGIPSALRGSLRTQNDYDRLMDLYQREMLPEALLFMQQAAQFAVERVSAFMCFEKDIIVAIESPLLMRFLKATGLPITHL